MPTDDLAAYQRHLKSFTDEYHPQGATESHLVQALADTAWRLNRAAALESNLLTLATQHRSFVDKDPLVEDALTLAAAVESQSRALANLSLHTQRLSRQFERTAAHLRELQKTRRSREQEELDGLLDIMNMFESKGEPYDPAQDGFVFSQSQINSRIRARNRENLALEAYDYPCAA
jgi:hypothetical protein